MRHRWIGVLVTLGVLVLVESLSHTPDRFITQSTSLANHQLIDAVSAYQAKLSVGSVNQIGLTSPGPSDLSLPFRELQIPTGLRVMVFTPHPDDETLSSAGLVQRILANSGQVRVVFVTNGDGFVDGVRREYGRRYTSTSDFLEYGEQRHNEALHALRELGLEPHDGIFLGFPDDGIDDLWADHWSKQQPYTSPHTRFDRPPYRGCLSRVVKYSGANLESEITRTLMDFRPDWVILPDPRDNHPDHCATGVFVLAALRTLREQKIEGFAHKQVFTYLVHYPNYPNSVAWLKTISTATVGNSSTVGKELSGIQWVKVSLSPEEMEAKSLALSAHESQMEAMGQFLKQFILPYEVFGRLDNDQVMEVPRDYAAQFGRPNS